MFTLTLFYPSLLICSLLVPGRALPLNSDYYSLKDLRKFQVSCLDNQQVSSTFSSKSMKETKEH